MNKTILYVIGVIVLVVVAAGGGFFAGSAYAQTQAQAAVTNFQQLRGAGAGGQNGQGAQASAGPCSFRQGGSFNESGTPSARQGGNAGNNGGGQSGGQFGQGGGFAQLGRCVAAGQVKSVDGNVVQISTATSVVSVKVDDKTQISKTATGTISDLTPGTRVIVFSEETGDSPTASGIQIQRAAGQ